MSQKSLIGYYMGTVYIIDISCRIGCNKCLRKLMDVICQKFYPKMKLDSFGGMQYKEMECCK